MNDLPWDDDPNTAFQTYIRSAEFRKKRRRPAIFAIMDDMPLRETSERMYSSMFRIFNRWIEERGVRIREVTADHILAFLDQREEVVSTIPAGEPTSPARARVARQKQRESRIRARYLGLRRRVYDPIKVQSKSNPAEEAATRLISTQAFGSDKPSCVLTEQEQERFLAAIPPYVAPTLAEESTAWKQRRDRALQLLMYGAGLTTAEIRGLYVENIRAIGDGEVWVDVAEAASNGRSAKHSVKVEAICVPDLLTWIEERKTINTGKILFPSGRVEKEKHDANKLSQPTIFRMVQKTLQQAGVKADRQGPRTLRNTFAVNLQRKNATIEELKDQLGLRSLRATEGYVRAYTEWELAHDRENGPGSAAG